MNLTAAFSFLVVFICCQLHVNLIVILWCAGKIQKFHSLLSMRWCHNALHTGFCHVVSGILKSALLLLSCMHKITLVYQQDQRASFQVCEY